MIYRSNVLSYEALTFCYVKLKDWTSCPELYFVYTGDKKDVPDSMSLATEFFVGQKPFSDNEFKILNDCFVEYAVIGGMPAVVKQFLNDGTW